jgi:hypothetical protein
LSKKSEEKQKSGKIDEEKVKVVSVLGKSMGGGGGAKF